MNEKRVFSDERVIALLDELNVSLIQADLTKNDQVIKRDLKRADRSIIPVNLLYPADPSKPAILLEELVSPDDALEALERIR
ncbi:MAG: hypothetical protein OSA48_07360 [Akkermansiaceae bacterium]|nr:hypothetical protein [Akkermansiaceae bacterium]